MFRFYKEKKLWTSSILIIIFDGILAYYLPSYFDNISLFYPMLTVSLIPFLFYERTKEYYELIFILGLIYDIFYSNIFLFNALIFLLLGKIDIKIMKNFKNNLFMYLLLIITNIILYDIINFFLILITNYSMVNINQLIYKIEHSLLLNILSGFVFYFWFKKSKTIHKM